MYSDTLINADFYLFLSQKFSLKDVPVQESRVGPKISQCALKWSTGAGLLRDTKKIS